MNPSSTVAGVRLSGSDELVDISIQAGRIAGITPARDRCGNDRWDGAWALPGLWDHHVHPREWAARRHRLDVSAATSSAETLRMVAAELRRSGSGGLIGHSLWHARWGEAWGDPAGPNRAALDAITGDVPVVLISGDVHSAWMNSAALAAYGLPLTDTGLVTETAWFAVMPQIQATSTETMDRLVIDAGREAAARGVVGIVDYDPGDTHAAWRRRICAGFDAHRVRASLWMDHLDVATDAGLRTGDHVPGTDELVRMGSLKIISDGSLNTHTAWCHDPYPGGGCGAPNLDEQDLREAMGRATAAGIDCAIHAIGDRAVTAALDAFAASGAAGSIEHAQLVRDADVRRFADLGVTASVQPEHAIDDRDIAEELWPGRTRRAYRFADFHAAGVAMALGSDAPVAPLDPWAGIAAAVQRSGDGRHPWHPAQRITAETAITAACGRRPRIRIGDRADLVLTQVNPLTADPAQLAEPGVMGTVCAGRITFDGR